MMTSDHSSTNWESYGAAQSKNSTGPIIEPKSSDIKKISDQMLRDVGQALTVGAGHALGDIFVGNLPLSKNMGTRSCIAFGADLSASVTSRYLLPSSTSAIADLEVSWLQPVLSALLYTVAGKVTGTDEQPLTYQLLTQLSASVGGKAVFAPVGRILLP